MPNHVTHNNTTTHTKAQQRSTAHNKAQHNTRQHLHRSHNTTHSLSRTQMGNTAQHNTHHTEPTPDPPSQTPTTQANTQTGNLLLQLQFCNFFQINLLMQCSFSNFLNYLLVQLQFFFFGINSAKVFCGRVFRRGKSFLRP